MNFNTILWVILIGFIIFIVYIYLKSYRKRHDNVSLNTGAPGTGKTLELTKSAKAQYFKNLRKVKWQNRFTRLFNKFRKSKKDLQELPVLISNYPIRMKGLFKAKEFSYMLTKEMVLLHEAVPLKSVFVITEFSSLIHNKDYNNPNAIYNIDEWVRFIRHYLQGGYIFADDQSSDNILVNARRRVGTVYNYLQFTYI